MGNALSQFKSCPWLIWLYLRAIMFWLPMIVSVVIWGSLLLLMFPFSYLQRVAFLNIWSSLVIWWLGITCGLKYKVEGLENIPAERASVIMSKHQSTWETIILWKIMPPLVWVAKKELMRVPFFGWGLAMLKTIALDRGAGRSAINSLVEQGTERLKNGLSIVIFPEGTRVLPGHKKRYKKGAAILAVESGFPVLPLAHNSGEFWPRHSFIKWPGTVTLVVGPLIESRGKTADELLAEVEAWIETAANKLIDPERQARAVISARGSGQ
ncbi:MAG: 1-acyl-sn-glycerol-3-phosphate acyltransferase [Gammaproteobacteria bacterium]|nr:1-acyl-sn-glycerol-3-phosphate acyltransferase [Gammaproteobacteria bacterium]